MAESKRQKQKLDLTELVSIRTCQPEDLSALRELQKLSIASKGWHFYSLSEVESKLHGIDDPAYTAELLGEKILLAHIGTILVGTIAWHPDKEHPQRAVISQVYTHPFFTDGGIATALVEGVEQTAFDKGYRFVKARSDLNSRAFFQRLGYESGAFENDSLDASTSYPLQIMARRLAASRAAGSKTDII